MKSRKDSNKSKISGKTPRQTSHPIRQSGGVHIEQSTIASAGDIVGRDKITITIAGIHLEIVRRWLYLLAPMSLLLVGIAGILVYQLLPSPPRRLKGQFNVAVVAFATDTNAGSFDHEIGTKLSEWICQRLWSAYVKSGAFSVMQGGACAQETLPSQSDDQITVDIEHYPAIVIENGEKAREFADSINAYFVVYGQIASQGDGALMFTPQFHVSDLFGAEEVTGPNRLGKPLRLGRLLQFELEANKELAARTQALELFAIGSGLFALEEPDRAIEFFTKAEAVPNWDDSEGKEVLYLFQGSAYLKKGDYVKAQARYDKALATNNQYARAFIGLGRVLYDQGIRSIPIANLPGEYFMDLALIRQAIPQYDRALTASDKPDAAFVDQKARFNRGLAYSALARFGAASKNGSSADAAAQDFHSVAQAYEEQDRARAAPILKQLAARSYIQQGVLVYELGGNFEAGMGYYNQALAMELHDASEIEARYHLGYAYLTMAERGQTARYEDAVKEFTVALDLVPLLEPADLALVKSKVEEIYLGLGQARAGLGDCAAALSAFGDAQKNAVSEKTRRQASTRMDALKKRCDRR